MPLYYSNQDDASRADYIIPIFNQQHDFAMTVAMLN